LTEQTDQAPHRGSGRPLTLLQLTDTHLQADPDASLYGVNADRALREVVSAAHRHSPKADLALLTGDLVHDGSVAGYRRLAEHIARLATPAYAIPGNHDEPAAMERLLNDPPLHCKSSVSIGAWQLLLVSSHVPGQDYGEIGKDQLRTLDRSLTARHGGHTLIVVHHPPVPIGSPWMDAIGLRDAPAFWDVVERHPGVRGVLWGHIHQEYLGSRGGIRLIGSPSTCVQFTPRSLEFAVDTRPPAYRWLRLELDGTIETGVVRVPGTTPHQA
jgi:Icc protein